MAHAVINLLGNLEEGLCRADGSWPASFRTQCLHSACTTFRDNTGRDLQIMKEIVRSRQDELAQLLSAHDFRKATSGTPGWRRHFLNTYHLLEMPEERTSLRWTTMSTTPTRRAARTRPISITETARSRQSLP